MRICFIAGGESIHTQRWVNYFSRHGHEVHLVSARFKDGYEIAVHRHPLVKILPRIWRVSQYLSGIVWLSQVRKIIRAIRPDIVDAHYITIKGYLGVASGFHPLVLTAWGSDVLIAPRQNPIHRLLTGYSLQKADCLVCDSETVRAGLLGLGAPPERIRKIFNGVDTEKFNPRWRDEVLITELGASGAPVVISIRNLTPAYNVEMFIRAASLVIKVLPQTRFLVAGEGDQMPHLKSLADSLGIAANVEFLGPIPHDRIPKYLASSNVYVSTSLSDSTSLSLQEAMASGLAPVITDLPANREWVNNGDNGFLVPIDDVQTLAERVLKVIQDKEMRLRFGQVSRKIIVERAEYHKEMKKAEELYQQLIG